MRNAEVIRKAEQFCTEHKIDAYPVDPISLCREYDFSVFEQPLDPEVSGFIVSQKENFMKYGSGKVIVVNASDRPRRQNFTVAHELAHYVLHRNPDDEIYAHRDAGQSGSIEHEANLFASCILMPENLIEEALERMHNRLWYDSSDLGIIIYIADEFLVSEEAAAIRLKQLKII